MFSRLRLKTGQSKFCFCHLLRLVWVDKSWITCTFFGEAVLRPLSIHSTFPTFVAGSRTVLKLGMGSVQRNLHWGSQGMRAWAGEGVVKTKCLSPKSPVSKLSVLKVSVLNVLCPQCLVSSMPPIGGRWPTWGGLRWSRQGGERNGRPGTAGWRLAFEWVQLLKLPGGP